jgi:REP element-mobilizing transposase RayT
VARPPRLEFAGALYHVTARGNERRDIFLGDADGDRAALLNVLGATCERFNWLIHAYCLMTNHDHRLVETPDANLSEGMRQLSGVFTQYVNRTHTRVGHLFQGRFKAILVERDSYLPELARYLVLNPVRAGMLPAPGDWPWRSYRAMVGEVPAAGWLETDAVPRVFSDERTTAVNGYRRLDQEVVVVRHQAVGVNQPMEALAGCAQRIQERSPITVRIAEKDVSPLVAACRHRIQRADKLQPRRSRYCCTPERLNPGCTASCWGVQCET